MYIRVVKGMKMKPGSGTMLFLKAAVTRGVNNHNAAKAKRGPGENNSINKHVQPIVQTPFVHLP